MVSSCCHEIIVIRWWNISSIATNLNNIIVASYDTIYGVLNDKNYDIVVVVVLENIINVGGDTT